MTDIIAGAGVAGLSVVTARYLEEMEWFQRLPPDTKRLLAVSIAALIALVMHIISAASQAKEPDSVMAATVVALGIVLQQVYHALTKQT